MKFGIVLLLVGTMIVPAINQAHASTLHAPVELKCEYMSNPLGIDVVVPRLTWQLAGDGRNISQSAYQILVADTEAALQSDEGNLWDSGKVESGETVLIPFAGKSLSSGQACFWKVRAWDQDGNPTAWSESAHWSMGLLNSEDWKAKWIGYDAPAPEHEHDAFTKEGGLELPPPPYLRNEFNTQPEITRATVYASALGIYELYLNGERVGSDVFSPGWTEYKNRVYYNTYDVTDMLKADDVNAIGAILADGWYASYIGFRLLQNRERPRDYYGDATRLCVQLEIEYADGSKEIVVTNEDWKATYGKIIEADLQMGEARDYRLEMPGWHTPGFDALDWDNVVVGDTPDILVQAYRGLPVRIHENIPAQSVTELKPGTFIYDLGQNMVGWVRIKAQGAPGQRVMVRHAEMLADDGTLYTEALRKARAIDTYYLKGDGVEILEPAFTFHGFQYVEISGLEQAPKVEDVVGVVVHNELPRTGFFEASEPLLNQLVHNIWWGQKGNFLEVPTDCPQRDERLGWTGDAQFFMPTGAYMADVGAFFTKWLVDLVQDSQRDDGSFADVAPDMELGSGSVGWGDAAMICTWNVYKYYNDTRIIEEHWDNLVKGMDHLINTSENYIRTHLGYGDWLNKGGGAKDEVISTAYFAHMAELMAEMAEAIGRTEAAERYTELHRNIRNAFIKSFILEDGSILESSQTGYALVFAFDLVPDDMREQTAARFAEEIAEFDYHLATGFIGTPRLLPSLEEAGHIDLAYRLLLNTTYPSWLFQVTLGATTMWERWDGWTPDQGFQNSGMNSFNHFAFGAVGEWLYSTVGGIVNGGDAFKTIQIRPEPGGDLDYAKTRYESIRGPIATHWQRAGADLIMNVSVPVNTKARIYLPVTEPEMVTESGDPLSESEDIKVVGVEDGVLVVEAGSGEYNFVCKGAAT